jgi:hypothetical protein
MRRKKGTVVERIIIEEKYHNIPFSVFIHRIESRGPERSLKLPSCSDTRHIMRTVLPLVQLNQAACFSGRKRRQVQEKAHMISEMKNKTDAVSLLKFSVTTAVLQWPL